MNVIIKNYNTEINEMEIESKMLWLYLSARNGKWENMMAI